MLKGKIEQEILPVREPSIVDDMPEILPILPLRFASKLVACSGFKLSGPDGEFSLTLLYACISN